MRLKRLSRKKSSWDQTYLNAYKKFRYWISFLYILILAQCWIIFSIPESGILAENANLIWNNNFLTYFKSSFNPDTSQAEKIKILGYVQNSFKYKLGEFLVNPNDKNYFSKTKSDLDSLVVFGLIDSSSAILYFDTLKSLIPKSIEFFKSVHGARSDSLIEKVGNVMVERRKLLNKDRNEFQNLLDSSIISLSQQLIANQINNNLHQKLVALQKDDEISLATLQNINKTKYVMINKLLDKNLLKNPYLDLPLKTQYVLIIILILSSILFAYSNLLYKYYYTIETKVSGNKLSLGLHTPSLKNILHTLGINLPHLLSYVSSLFFYTLFPLFIISYFTIFLFEISLLSLSIIFMIGLIRIIISIITKSSKLT